jgi:hypothetical protein
LELHLGEQLLSLLELELAKWPKRREEKRRGSDLGLDAVLLEVAKNFRRAAQCFVLARFAVKSQK